MLTHIPKQIADSDGSVIGDVEKFFELLEQGFFAEQHDRIIADHTRWLREEIDEVASRSTMFGDDPYRLLSTFNPTSSGPDM